MNNAQRFSDIEFQNENTLKLTFIDKNKQPLIIPNTDKIEIILFDDYLNYIKVFGEVFGRLDMTPEDWKNFKNVISQSSKYVFCGDNAILVLDNMTNYKNFTQQGTLYVCSKRGFYYEIDLNYDYEKANDFISALEKNTNKNTSDLSQTEAFSK